MLTGASIVFAGLFAAGLMFTKPKIYVSKESLEQLVTSKSDELISLKSSQEFA